MNSLNKNDNLNISTIINEVGDACVVIDKNLIIKSYNENFQKFLPIEPTTESLLNKRLTNIFPQFQQTIFYQTIINSIQTKKNCISAGSYRDFNNKKYSVIIRIYPQTDNLFYILIHKCDKQIKKDLYVKQFDQLTDLENRFSYDQNIKNLIGSKNQLSFILIDLKHFNKFNVTYGHSTSDLILIEIANRLKKCISPQDYLYRMNGDQFLMVVNTHKIEKILYKIDAQFNRKIIIENQTLVDFEANKTHSENINLSVFNIENTHITENNSYSISKVMGIYQPLTNQEESILDSLHCVEAALQAAKLKKLHHLFFNPNMLVKNRDLFVLEAEILRAIREEEFEIYYQPKIDIKTEKIIGAETLIRWNHPIKGMISPGYFLPYSKELGLMSAIDQYVINQVLKNIAYYVVPISINLSGSTFSDPKEHEIILDKLSTISQYASLVNFEITENEFISIDKSLPFVEKLKSNNFSIGIDDFGTGYCSLEYLLKYPCDYLKIERAFIHNIHLNKKNYSVVDNIIKLGHSLGTYIVAEGVENKEELKVLKKLKCDVIQGYYYCKPVPFKDFVAYCQTQGIARLIDY